MITSYCIDVSGSMTSKQLLSALNRVSDDWKHGDYVYVFDHASAEPIHFEELVNYSLEIDDINELRNRLFKAGSYHRWQGSGAVKAAMLAPSYTVKVCVTDGDLMSDDFKSYSRIIRIL